MWQHRQLLVLKQTRVCHLREQLAVGGRRDRTMMAELGGESDAMASRGCRDAAQEGAPSVSGIGRREFLRLSGAAGGVALGGSLVAACASGQSNSTSSQSPASGAVIAGTVPGPSPVSGGRYGGRAVAGYAEPPDSNDPAQSYNLFSYDIVTELVFFGGLLAYGGQYGGPIPNLAAKMPEISADKKTFTFTLRPGVKFHNGREIVAED